MGSESQEDYTCKTIQENRNANFYQLNTVLQETKKYVELFTNQGIIKIDDFEVPSELLIALQNLDALLTDLFQESESQLNEAQERYLLISERTLVTFYCYIRFFIEHKDDIKNKARAVQNKHTKNLASEFYYHAAYELRTPYNGMATYTMAQANALKTKEWEEFVNRIFSSPFIPENKIYINKIRFWTEKLGEFMDDLPSKWQALSGK